MTDQPTNTPNTHPAVLAYEAARAACQTAKEAAEAAMDTPDTAEVRRYASFASAAVNEATFHAAEALNHARLQVGESARGGVLGTPCELGIRQVAVEAAGFVASARLYAEVATQAVIASEMGEDYAYTS